MAQAGTIAQKLAILAGGGPGPGINSVIRAASLRALPEGREVLGLPHGYSQIMQGKLDGVHRLWGKDVRAIRFDGAAVLGTSRANPTKQSAHLDRVVQFLSELGVAELITIGGEDTAFSAMKIAGRAAARCARSQNDRQRFGAVGAYRYLRLSERSPRGRCTGKELAARCAHRRSCARGISQPFCLRGRGRTRGLAAAAIARALHR